ncbi:MAG: hypothetical protein IIC78_04640 [Chloroflexi bacterium]|nr:hypothetical protein [Chloroflexota bacterium]
MAEDRLEGRIDWLDKQRRKDADRIKTLQEKVAKAEKLLAKQAKQVKEAVSEIARISAQASQIRQFDDAVANLRADFSRQLQGLVESQQKRDTRLEKIRNAEREMASKSVEELRLELKQLQDIRQTLETRRHEEIRISRELNTMEKKFDEIKLREEGLSRSITTSEDSRLEGAKRLAELQSESTDLRKKIESLRGLVDTVEDRSRRFESFIAELTENENNRREDQNIWIEQQELGRVSFEKEWKHWLKSFEAFKGLAEESDIRMQMYDENYRAMKKTKIDLEKILDRLERRISEISEVQRIAEDKIKSDWSMFQADDMKRWNTFQLTNDEQWKEHDRLHEKLGRDIGEMNESLVKGLAVLENLSESGRRQVTDLLNIVRQWAAEQERQMEQVK